MSRALCILVFWHKEMEIYVIAHVDDLLAVGDERGLNWIRSTN